MKNVSTLLFIICFGLISQLSSGQNLAWVNPTGSGGMNDVIQPEATAIDVNGNVFATGSFTGTFDFQPGAGVISLSSVVGIYRTYIQKLDANGSLVWVRGLDGSSFTIPTGMKTDGNGDVYVCGTFDSPVDFDPGAGTNIITPTGNVDAYILKLTAAGNLAWVHTYGAAGVNTAAQALTVDQNNNVIISGYFQDSMDFDPGPNVTNLGVTGYANMFVLKFNTSGGFVYAKSFPGSDYGDVKSMSVDATNHVYLTGMFYGTVDFDPGAGVTSFTSQNSDDLFVVKLDNSGTFNWAKTIGNDGYENVSGMGVDNNDNVYLAGSFSDSLDFDPGAAVNMQYANGFSDVMVVKLNASGNFVWGKHIGGQYSQQPQSLCMDNNNNLYMTGYFEDVTDFDPGGTVQNLTSAGNYDSFIWSLDENGGYRMAERLGDVDEDYGLDIQVSNSNVLVGLGMFYGTVDFDPNATVSNVTALSFNSGDGYLFKWDLCAVTSSSLTAYQCNSYTLNGQTYTSSGNYTQVFTNAAGCDSLVNLNLTIGSTNTTINPVVCSGNSFTLNGQTYTAAGTYTQNYTNVAGCDSNTIINLSFGVPSSSSITDVACDFYFFGSQTLFNSGIYTQVIPNASGCDSTITLYLTINNSVYNTILVNACGSYPYNGQTYYNSGTYTHYFVSAQGCDSVVDLVLYINPIQAIVQTVTACNEYFFNGQTYTNSGTYTGFFTSIYGCDSTHTINLTVNHPNVAVTQAGPVMTASAAAPATYQWINCNGNTLIPGANGQTYTATANGSYAVIVTENGCSDTSACKTVTGIGVQDYLTKYGFSIYPNPAKDEITISFNQSIADADIEILTVSGQVVSRLSSMSGKTFKIALNGLAKGMYFLVVEASSPQGVKDGGVKQVGRFTKE
ncbi:MAG: T9SS type A sorting domain-containing protein [Chitinophagaceae bacterium]|nr:T9SS type A sorting domain-containing protein [Chitinophagaceae bacterium]